VCLMILGHGWRIDRPMPLAPVRGAFLWESSPARGRSPVLNPPAFLWGLGAMAGSREKSPLVPVSSPYQSHWEGIWSLADGFSDSSGSMGWPGRIIGGLGHPSGRKRAGGVGARNQISSFMLSPVLIQWKGKKL